MLWLEGSGTVADAKHNERKAVECQGRVGGENNKKMSTDGESQKY